MAGIMEDQVSQQPQNSLGTEKNDARVDQMHPDQNARNGSNPKVARGNKISWLAFLLYEYNTNRSDNQIPAIQVESLRQPHCCINLVVIHFYFTSMLKKELKNIVLNTDIVNNKVD
ncbi:hypothetical protein Ddc_06193 [Ditylenchus destructor]|nr:hypothetical protein Ddc_06193 [Ditylenchus destructor]